MAATQPQCPNCHQTVPADAHACPHCGVYLQMPDYPGFAAHTQAGQAPAPAQNSALPHEVATPRPAALPPIAFESSLPDAIKQFDSAATTNITISGVLIAFYAGAIFAGRVTANAINAIVYAMPVVLLLITVIFSVRVFYPAGYLTDDYPTLFKKKDERLRYSLLLLEISVALLAVAVFVYLVRPT